MFETFYDYITCCVKYLQIFDKIKNVRSETYISEIAKILRWSIKLINVDA